MPSAIENIIGLISTFIFPIGFFVGAYFLVKQMMAASYNHIIKIVKSDPEKFKAKYLEEGQRNKDQIMRELERIEKVTKVKVQKPTPPNSTVKILATTIDGGKYWYKIGFKAAKPPSDMKIISIEKIIGEFLP